jgi:hypothetical protein
METAGTDQKKGGETPSEHYSHANISLQFAKRLRNPCESRYVASMSNFFFTRERDSKL